VCAIGYQEVPGSLYYAPEFALPIGLYNWSHYENPEVTKLLGEARASTDPAVTAEKFVEAQAIFAPDNLQVTLAGMNSLLYLGDGLSGAPASIAYHSSPWALTLGGTS
jgi:peptide/nickel transport system substrate-binding protein